MKNVSSFSSPPSPIKIPLRNHPQTPTKYSFDSPAKKPNPYDSSYATMESHIDKLTASIAKLKEEFDKNGFSDKEIGIDLYSNNVPQEVQEITSEFSLDDHKSNDKNVPITRRTELPHNNIDLDSAFLKRNNKKNSDIAGHKHQTSIGDFLIDLKDKIMVSKSQMEDLINEISKLKEENRHFVDTIDDLNKGLHVTKVIENCKSPQVHKRIEDSLRNAIYSNKCLETKLQIYEEVAKEFGDEHKEFTRRITEELNKEEQYEREHRSFSPKSSIKINEEIYDKREENH